LIIWLLAVRGIERLRFRLRRNVVSRLRRRADFNRWSLTFLWISAVFGVAVALSNCSTVSVTKGLAKGSSHPLARDRELMPQGGDFPNRLAARALAHRHRIDRSTG
jgi:hypothetical protein